MQNKKHPGCSIRGEIYLNFLLFEWDFVRFSPTPDAAMRIALQSPETRPLLSLTTAVAPFPLLSS
jgi:hypothetical protein